MFLVHVYNGILVSIIYIQTINICNFRLYFLKVFIQFVKSGQTTKERGGSIQGIFSFQIAN